VVAAGSVAPDTTALLLDEERSWGRALSAPCVDHTTTPAAAISTVTITATNCGVRLFCGRAGTMYDSIDRLGTSSEKGATIDGGRCGAPYAAAWLACAA